MSDIKNEYGIPIFISELNRDSIMCTAIVFINVTRRNMLLLIQTQSKYSYLNTAKCCVGSLSCIKYTRDGKLLT